MIATWILSRHYIEEPEVAALIVIFVAALFLVIGNIIITGFNRMAESNRMKSEFLFVVSHQLRSPLAVFNWTLDALEMEIRRGAKITDFYNFVVALRENTNKMIRLVNSFLEVSRIEARTFVLKKGRFSLAEITKSVVDGFKNYAESQKVNLVIEEGKEALPEIEADREKIEMVIQNLVDNAIRYSPSGGRVVIRIENDNRFLRWSIQDQGVGIPAAQQKYIFQKFFRAKNHNSTYIQGTGVGLYIAKTVVEASGGKIGFQSQEGKGSTFWFTLPLIP